ncbi:LPXTG cell wall anchor domain-containing protein [Planosporangium thailandense]|uniref:LPXTG cell wall anchor domain-containing protein n=1 Tax=Planosporangium thailandense TaxID=765197 RepID=A0ABX0Y333_9ACTN|nr:LPXTG cell wall anchor domain-containing protein [Planosporangium thailandense]NJC72796.1 LPXTG cell wall anchor domain-containing protein [Planosporangium thailandense]
MIHRGLVRTAIAAGAMFVGAAVAAAPAAAAETPSPDFGFAKLTLPHVPLKAGDFSPKGCDGIPGGAKTGTDGWVFNQPVKGATDYGYIVGLLDMDNKQVVTLGISADGVTGLELDQSAAQGLKDGTLGSSAVKSLAAAAAADDSSDGVKEVPAPKGVAGGLTSTGEGWLQTPAGWQLASGALLYSPQVEGAPEDFTLARVCAPKTESSPTPTASVPAPPSKAPGAGGGSGSSLPVTGANVAAVAGVGVVLVAIGALFVLRRRRDTTKFVA